MRYTVISKLASGTDLPKMYEVRQNIKTESLDGAEIEDTVKRGFARNDISQRIHPGMRIAVTCGSRGVANIVVILRTIVHELKKRGAQPFVFPAMGSHGGAIAENQRSILEHLGVTEEYTGAPIRASIASDVIESLFLPPVASSPFPRSRYLPSSISRAHCAREGSHTMLARVLVSSPSDTLGDSLKRYSLETSSSTASPRNSSLSLHLYFSRCLSFV